MSTFARSSTAIQCVKKGDSVDLGCYEEGYLLVTGRRSFCKYDCSGGSISCECCRMFFFSWDTVSTLTVDRFHLLRTALGWCFKPRLCPLIAHTYTVCYHDILLNLVIDVFKKGFDCVEVVDTIDAVCDSESEHTELRDDGRCYRPESGENGCFDTEKLTYPVSKWYSCVACSRIPVLSLLANPIVCSIFSCHCTKNVGQTQFHLCDSTHLLGNVVL